MSTIKLLDDILVLDFSQFLSGPSASLRLSDLGARVIKIEKPVTGDICRTMYVSDVVIEKESTIFHAVNRNKESYAADLKNPDNIDKIRKLICKADVLIHNFRPGVMARLGFDYDNVKAMNPDIVYGEISGYSDEGPWKDLPGQDLLLQSLSGLTNLNHDADHPPSPMGISVVDLLAGTHLTQGILAALLRRAVRGNGALVQVNMLESALDFQFEVFTCFLNDGNELPQRSSVNNAHAYVAAPYGVYKTADGFIVLAMADILVLGTLLNCTPLSTFTNKSEWFSRRDEIKSILKDHLITRTSDYWLSILEPADIWCARVMNYDEMVKEDGYHALNMETEVKIASGHVIRTTRCPIRVNGELLVSRKGAPGLGEHNDDIESEFTLSK